MNLIKNNSEKYSNKEIYRVKDLARKPIEKKLDDECKELEKLTDGKEVVSKKKELMSFIEEKIESRDGG